MSHDFLMIVSFATCPKQIQGFATCVIYGWNVFIHDSKCHGKFMKFLKFKWCHDQHLEIVFIMIIRKGLVFFCQVLIYHNDSNSKKAQPSSL
jgi:hypothetical protein